MSQAIPTQPPAVVLRSHDTHLRILLAIAISAVIGLSVAVAILAGDDGPATSATPAQAAGTALVAPPAARAPESRSNLCSSPDLRRCTPPRGAPGAQLRVTPPPTGQRYDGGPEEGSRGPGH